MPATPVHRVHTWPGTNSECLTEQLYKLYLLQTGREGAVTSDWSGKLSRKGSLGPGSDVSEDQEEMNRVIGNKGVYLSDFRSEGRSRQNLHTFILAPFHCVVTTCSVL